MGPSTTSQKHDDKEVENKRRCVRRQSVQLKSHERKPTENLFEIEDAKFDSPKQTGKENREESCIPNSEAGVTTRRSSLGRPMRKAVVKVQSYKEVPLKFKMRRVPERM
ncbi:SHUGOSHIN 2-like [Morus notabilis]|nr:SHUGOSHIN 2-like [Morus notabilis]